LFNKLWGFKNYALRLAVLALATRSRGYTGKTHLRGLKILDFLLVHGGGLRLCSSEFYSPNTRSRGYTGKTHLRGLKILDFLLVHGGGLRLCSSEFYSPNTFQTSS
jgi:hypothetical protein